MISFADFKTAEWITLLDAEYYPDYLEEARVLYEKILSRFTELVEQSKSSIDLLEKITKEPKEVRIQLLRVFRKCVSPNTSVEMLKKKKSIPQVIEDFGSEFRPIRELRDRLKSRPQPDEALMAILYEYKDRGQKGYELTGRFFNWFEETFGDEYVAQGPTGAGADIQLKKVLDDFEHKIPADILIRRKKDNTPLVVGFARYDSDRGGSQEDDRTGGNRDKVTEIRKYALEKNVPLKILFLNDGPGLLLGSMWADYVDLETYGEGDVMVCTLKMLKKRLTKEWLES